MTKAKKLIGIHGLYFNGLIVGGGIAGLPAAIALGRVSVHCDVVEITDETLGAPLALFGRATDDSRSFNLAEVDLKRAS